MISDPDQAILSPDRLHCAGEAGCREDVAAVNLACATGLPGSEGLDVGRCLATLEEWAGCVRRETDRYMYRFRAAPHEYEGSEAYFRVLVPVTVLQRDLGVGYNPDRIRDPDFTDSRDLFLHGLLSGRRQGTCVSLPVLYAAVGRRLGYPMRLALAKSHVFNVWDGTGGGEGRGGGRFNIEASGRGLSVFPDEHYKTWPRAMTTEDLRSGEYLRPLPAAEERALFLGTRGHCLEDLGRLDEARAAYAQACRLAPQSRYYRVFLGDLEARQGRRRFIPAAPINHS